MKKKKVVLIDDNVDFCKLIKMDIERSGEVTMEVAYTAQEGIELVKSFQPDIIFLDILIPKMDGGMVAEVLKHNTSTQDIPIVFLTSMATKEEVQSKHANIGGHQFLAKPITAKELLVYIQDFFKEY